VGNTFANCPFLKSEASSEEFFTFALVTAPFLSCALPTEFLGSAVTAYVVPPSATARAMMAMTVAGDSRRVLEELDMP
jgi:hypothetical protein